MNSTSALYIIGNGFDRHHGIPSDYRDFGNYLKRIDRLTYRAFETYFNVDDDFWCDFEEQLANFDTDSVIDDASNFLMSYGAEDWSDSGHHAYQYELERVVKAIATTMRNRFYEWVRQLAIPAAKDFREELLPLDRQAIYLSFNYTQTLQQTYAIPDSRITHIHGNASKLTDQLILGHGWKRLPSDSFNHRIDEAETDTRIIEGNQIIDGYFSTTFKPTEEIIAQHQHFFVNLKSVQQIFVVGHSLSEIDSAYLLEVVRHIDNSRVKWKVSYHNDQIDAMDKFSRLGIDMSLASFFPLGDTRQWGNIE